jgi:hypothetical protein
LEDRLDEMHLRAPNEDLDQSVDAERSLDPDDRLRNLMG